MLTVVRQDFTWTKPPRQVPFSDGGVAGSPFGIKLWFEINYEAFLRGGGELEGFKRDSRSSALSGTLKAQP